MTREFQKLVTLFSEPVNAVLVTLTAVSGCQMLAICTIKCFGLSCAPESWPATRHQYALQEASKRSTCQALGTQALMEKPQMQCRFEQHTPTNDNVVVKLIATISLSRSETVTTTNKMAGVSSKRPCARHHYKISKGYNFTRSTVEHNDILSTLLVHYPIDIRPIQNQKKRIAGSSSLLRQDQVTKPFLADCEDHNIPAVLDVSTKGTIPVAIARNHAQVPLHVHKTATSVVDQ